MNKSESIDRLANLKNELDKFPGVLSVGFSGVHIEHDTFFQLFRKEDCECTPFEYVGRQYAEYRITRMGALFYTTEEVKED